MINARRIGAIGIAVLAFSSACKTPDSGDSGSEVKVVNGVELPDGSVPAVVLLNVGTLGNCTGTFVNETTVITAAHCVVPDDATGGVSIKGIDSVNVFVPAAYKQLRDANDPQYKLKDIAVLVYPDGTAAQLGIENFADVAPTAIKSGEKFTILGYGASDFATGSGAGVFRGGTNSVLEVEEDVILFKGAVIHPDSPTGENVSAGGGDSGGPMLNEGGELVGTTEGGAILNGEGINVYITTTGPLARALFKQAIQCNNGRPCAKNFKGSGITGGVDGGDGGDSGGGVCGQASQNTKVCINAERTLVTIFNGGVQAQYQVAQQQNSQLLPGGVAHIGVANLSFIQGMSAATTVSFIVHPNGTGRLSYLSQGQWVTFGGGGNFSLTSDTGGGGSDTGSGLCGQATQNTSVCINSARNVVTLTRTATGQQAQYQVQQTSASQLLPGGTAYYGIANLSFIQGMSAAQQVSFIVHPNGLGKLVYMTTAGWQTFGGVPTFNVQEE